MSEDLEGKGKYHPMIVTINKKLLLDDTFTDLAIKVGNDTVYAHAAIVGSRCEEIISFQPDDKFERAKKQKKKLEIKIKDDAIASGATMNRVLEFLYTGGIEFPKMTDRDILLLIKAARFLKLTRLTYLCEKWISEHLTLDNIFDSLKAANELNEERIKGFCMQFALQNYNSVISNKNGIFILGIELFQEVVASFQQNPKPPEPIKPIPQDTLLEDLRKLYHEMPYSDFIVTLGQENIRCHKAILSAHSDVFNNVLFKEGEIGVRLSPEAFKSVLKFLYYGDDEIQTLPACELITFTRKYKLPSLLQICEDIIRHGVSVESVVQILAVSYLPDGTPGLNEELRGKCLPFILQNFDRVDLKLIQTYNPLMVVDLLLDIQNSSKKGEYDLAQFITKSNAGPPVSARGHRKDQPARPPRHKDSSTSSKHPDLAASKPEEEAAKPKPPKRAQSTDLNSRNKVRKEKKDDKKKEKDEKKDSKSKKDDKKKDDKKKVKSSKSEVF